MSAANYRRAPSYRGDTLLGFTVSIDVGGSPAQLQSARLQLRLPTGALAYEWVAACSGNIVTLPDVPAEDTAKWPVGALDFDLEVTLAGGRVVTWLKGTQPIHADRTR